MRTREERREGTPFAPFLHREVICRKPAAYITNQLQETPLSGTLSARFYKWKITIVSRRAERTYIFGADAGGIRLCRLRNTTGFAGEGYSISSAGPAVLP